MKEGIEILPFGQITDITGKEPLFVDDVQDLEALSQLLISRFPPLAAMKYTFAVNQVIIKESIGLKPGDVVAILPPFSGG